MKRIPHYLITSALLVASSAQAETLVARQTVRSKAILAENDLAVISETVPGALTHPMDAVGMEARVVLYAGRPIRRSDLVPPAAVERNALVTLIFSQNGLAIAVEGRALGRGAVGDRIRVMNSMSRATVSGTIDEAGRVIVSSLAQNFPEMEKK